MPRTLQWKCTTAESHTQLLYLPLKEKIGGWREGSVTKSPGCSFRFQPSTWWLEIIYSSSRRADAFIQPLQAPGVHLVHSHYMQTKHPETYKKKKTKDIGTWWWKLVIPDLERLRQEEQTFGISQCSILRLSQKKRRRKKRKRRKTKQIKGGGSRRRNREGKKWGEGP